MPLKDRIAEAIEGSGKSKADIARACEVTNAAVTHWLNGETASLKAEKALALELATGYRAQWILTGRGSRKAEDPYWPFASIPVGRFLALPDRQQGIVEAKLEQAINEAEANAQTRQVLRGLGSKKEAMSDEEVAKRLPPIPEKFTLKPVGKKAVIKKRSA